MTSSITDGSTTINFSGMISFDFDLESENLLTMPYPNGQGTISMDYGYKRSQYTIESYFESGTTTAYAQFATLQTMWQTQNATYKYQRKFSIDMVDGTALVFQGKIQSIVSHQTYGDNFNVVEFKIVVFVDTLSQPQIP